MHLLTLPDQAGADIRAKLGLRSDDPLRVSFLAGNGDVVGTYHHWRAAEHDPRVPVVTYSAMFYELMRQIGAQAQVISPYEGPQDGEIRFDQVARAPWSGRIGYWRSQASFARNVAQVVRRFDPHVVLVHSDVPPAAWPALGRGPKLILSAHNTYWPMGRRPTDLKNKLKLGVLQRQARALDGTICTSAECLRQIRALTAPDFPGAVQTPQMLRSFEVETRHQARRLLYLGRVETSKGIFDLLDAFSALAPRHPDLRLIFAGTGGASDALQARIKDAPPGVSYSGQLDATGVHEAIAAADLVVCPTTRAFHEGLAMVTLEAAAHGIPSVLSDVVPAMDLLGEACAIYPANDVMALTSCIEALITNDTAYQNLANATQGPRAGLQDRARSWGSELGKLMMVL